MIATTYGYGKARRRSERSGFAQKAYDRLVKARSAQADRFVNTYLRSQNDASLRMLGFSRDDIVRLKSGTPVRSLLQ